MFDCLPSLECKQKLVSYILNVLEDTKSAELASHAAKVLYAVGERINQSFPIVITKSH